MNSTMDELITRSLVSKINFDNIRRAKVKRDEVKVKWVKERK